MQKLIVANYKMNGNAEFYDSVKSVMNNLKVKDTEIVLCPPFIYVPNLKINNKNISVGVQDISIEINKKSTGQISPIMIKEFGAKYAIIGHSERRAIGESNEIVAAKVLNAVNNDLTPIICVGEEDKKSSLDILVKQVETALSESYDNIIFAYEPVWAIGSGEIPTNSQINKALNIIKETASKKGLNNIKVLYGGSVNDTNYMELLKTEADGFLLGGISLNTDKLISLIQGVENE